MSIYLQNVEHVHPLPTQDISESQDSQTTQEIRNTNAGSGLHDASCCASDSGGGDDLQSEFIRICKIIADDPRKLTEGINWWANIITMIHDGCDLTVERMSFDKYD